MKAIFFAVLLLVVLAYAAAQLIYGAPGVYRPGVYGAAYPAAVPVAGRVYYG